MEEKSMSKVDEAVQEVMTQEEEAEAKLHELVEIQLFKDNRRYKEDLKIGINGRTWVIQRGVPVKVPRYVAVLIEQSQRQDQASDSMMLALQERYEERTRTQTQA